MSTIKRIVNNSMIVIVGIITFKIMSIFLVIYLARYLGTELFGIYNFIFAYLAFFGIIYDLGLYTILVREISRKNEFTNKLIGNAYLIRGFLTFISVTFAIIIINLTTYSAEIKSYVLIAAITLFFTSFSEFYTAIFQANLKMKYSIYSKLVFKFFSLVLIFLIIYYKGPLLYIIYALIVSELVKTLLNYNFSRKFITTRFQLDFSMIKYLLISSTPLMLSGLVDVIHNRVDVIMLSYIIGFEDVGIYSAAYKISEPFGLIPYALMLSIFPLMSSAFNKAEEKLVNIYVLSYRYILIITVPVALLVTLLSESMIAVVYGQDFIEATLALQILIWTLVFLSLGRISLQFLVAINKQNLYFSCILAGAVFNILLNLFLIPKWNYIGASIATVMSNIVILILVMYFVTKNYPQISAKLIQSSSKLLIPVVSVTILGLYSLESPYKLWMMISCLPIYLILLYTTKSITGEDIKLIKQGFIKD